MKYTLFAELRRRNVLRAAVLYAGAIWACNEDDREDRPFVHAALSN